MSLRRLRIRSDGGALGLLLAALAPLQGLKLPPADPPQDPAGALAPGDWLAGAGDARDESGDGAAFVEHRVERATAFVGEIVRVELRFGLDADVLRDDLVPLFRRALDVPVLVEAADLDVRDASHADGATATVACNGRVARARVLPDRVVGGRTFRVYALDARVVESAPGPRAIAAPRLSYARAVGWTDDFVRGRTPLARQDAFVRGAALELRVDPLPEEGRPAGFSGAVGRFRAEARVEWGTDASARYELVISGDGDLSTAHAPGAGDFPGFALRGVLDDGGASRRAIVYDLELADGAARALAPVRYVAFDPTPPGAYVVVETASIPVPEDVRARNATTVRRAGSTTTPVRSLGARLGMLGVVVAALIAIAAVVVRARSRERRRWD